jgi:hypothetical protein
LKTKDNENTFKIENQKYNQSKEVKNVRNSESDFIELKELVYQYDAYHD